MPIPNMNLIDEVSKRAKESLLLYQGCAPAVLLGLRHHFDFLTDDLIRVSMALAGGCSASNGSCGAYCGGLLAIAAKYQPAFIDLSSGGLAKREESRKKRFEFRDAFLKEFGSTLCPDIQQLVFGKRFNMIDQKEWQEFMSLPGHLEKSSTVIEKAARMAAEILLIK